MKSIKIVDETMVKRGRMYVGGTLSMPAFAVQKFTQGKPNAVRLRVFKGNRSYGGPMHVKRTAEGGVVYSVSTKNKGKVKGRLGAEMSNHLKRHLSLKCGETADLSVTVDVR